MTATGDMSTRVPAMAMTEAALAAKYLPDGSCGVVSFGVAGGRAAAETFMKNLKLAQIATHVADARTCVLHPANATHRQMNDAELEAAGISAALIKFPRWKNNRAGRNRRCVPFPVKKRHREKEVCL